MKSLQVTGLKGILLDVDNTMVGHDKQVSPRLATVLEALSKKSEFKLAVCTGRTYAMLHHYIFSFFNPDVYHVVAGGAQVINKQGAVLWEHLLPNDTVHDIASWVKGIGGGVSFGQHSTYYASTSVARKHFAEQKWNYSVDDVEVLRDWSAPLINLLELPVDPTERVPHKDELTLKFMSNEHGFYADVTAKGVTKATGAARWAAHYGFTLDDVIAVGDSANDVELLQSVGHPVAMGNALPELKDIASRVIGNANEDGLAIALEELL